VTEEGLKIAIKHCQCMCRAEHMWRTDQAAIECVLEALQAAQARVTELEQGKARLLQTLTSLRNEARGFLSQANEQDHGYTNIQCLQNRIDDASRVIDAMKEPQ